MEKEDEIVTSDDYPNKDDRRIMKVLKRRIPLLEWGPRYNRLAALGDLVAGITLGLTLVPQSIAYASLAGLPLHYGLYSSFLGTMIYAVFGSVKEVSIGPTSLMALLTLQTCKHLPLEFVPLLSFMSGIMVLLMGILRLGFLVDLISPAVTSGFTSSTAIIIVFSQLKSLLGLSFTAESPFENMLLIGQNWRKIRWADCALSCGCITVLLAMRKLGSIKASKRVSRCLWLLSISRNALVVCLASLLAYFTIQRGVPLFKLSGRVEPGLPKFSLPSFSIAVNNETLSVMDTMKELGGSIIIVPIIMVLANLAIAKAFSSGRGMDASQEMVALGLANVFGSVAHAMPACGAFTRSALAATSGVRTPAAGMLAGGMTLMALMFLTKYFYFIPKASLASVLICAVIFMVDVDTVVVLWRRGRSEVLVLAGTVLVALVAGVELCVLAGALGDAARMLYALRATRVHAQCRDTVWYCEAPAWLVYCNASPLLASLLASLPANIRTVTMDLTSLSHIDYAAIKALDQMAKKLKARNIEFSVNNASAEVARKLDGFSWLDGRLLRCGEPGSSVRVSVLRCLSACAMRDDVSLVLHADRRTHALLLHAHYADTLPLSELQPLAAFICNLFSNVGPSEWLMYISEWQTPAGKTLSNMRATTKLCVTCLLHDDPTLKDLGSALLYNIATKDVKTVVFEEVCVELGMAALQFLSVSPPEPLQHRALVSLARLLPHSADLAPLLCLVGPPPAAYRGASQRCDEQIDLIESKIKK